MVFAGELMIEAAYRLTVLPVAVKAPPKVKALLPTERVKSPPEVLEAPSFRAATEVMEVAPVVLLMVRAPVLPTLTFRSEMAPAEVSERPVDPAVVSVLSDAPVMVPAEDKVIFCPERESLKVMAPEVVVVSERSVVEA